MAFRGTVTKPVSPDREEGVKTFQKKQQQQQQQADGGTGRKDSHFTVQLSTFLLQETLFFFLLPNT